MYKKTIFLVAALAVVLVFATVSPAQEWAEIIFGGYVTVTGVTPEGIMVLADTGIWVFNPNPTPITCNISHLIDKYGNILRVNCPLLDGGHPILSIPRGGNGWTTLGQLFTTLPDPWPQVGGTNKYTFRIACTGQADRVPVVQVKEVIYNTEQEIRGYQPISNPIANIENIRTWSETSLGGSVGTGKYKP